MKPSDDKVKARFKRFAISMKVKDTNISVKLKAES